MLRNRGIVSRQLIQQSLGFLQIGRSEALGEPIVDRIEQIKGLRTPALVAPKPRKAGRCPQLQELRALPLGDRDGLTIVPLSRVSIAGGDSADRRAAGSSSVSAHRSPVLSMICAASARHCNPSPGRPRMLWASASHISSNGV